MTKAEAKTWDDNFDNYISSAADFTGYQSQAIEVDARQYGASYASRMTHELLNAHVILGRMGW